MVTVWKLVSFVVGNVLKLFLSYFSHFSVPPTVHILEFLGWFCKFFFSFSPIFHFIFLFFLDVIFLQLYLYTFLLIFSNYFCYHFEFMRALFYSLNVSFYGILFLFHWCNIFSLKTFLILLVILCIICISSEFLYSVCFDLCLYVEWRALDVWWPYSYLRMRH